MNLRSGAVKQSLGKVKRKKTHLKNKGEICEDGSSMATGAAHQTDLKLMELMLDFKTEVTKQMMDLNMHFETLTLDTKEMRKEIKDIRTMMEETTTKLSDAQQRISDLEDQEKITNDILLHLLREERKMRDKLDYLENKSRQNNVRIYQVKEGAEGSDIVDFVKRLISENMDIPSEQLQIMAAHRSLTKKPETADAPPRSIVVRFLQWNTQQQVLRTAWSRKEIRMDGTRIYFDRDYSEAVQHERAKYGPIRHKLKERNVKSHILYPAKLKVFGEGEPTIYKTPEEAIKNLMELGVLTERPPAPSNKRGRSSRDNERWADQEGMEKPYGEINDVGAPTH